MKSAVHVGIDVGAISTESVALRGKELLAYTIVPTGAEGSRAARHSFNSTLEKADIPREEVRAVISTGYGRKGVQFADTTVTEITCHALGSSFLFPDTETVIDIGGQDSKVIFLKGGIVQDFVMNDRCAAGTGRFLEIMSRALETPLGEMGKESLLAHKSDKGDIRISSTCTVFAESEVVSLLAEGRPKGQIILALHRAIVERILSMAHRFRFGSRIMLSGGVAKNIGVVDCLQNRLGARLNIPDEPQIIGALGAALYSLRHPGK